MAPRSRSRKYPPATRWTGRAWYPRRNRASPSRNTHRHLAGWLAAASSHNGRPNHARTCLQIDHISADRGIRQTGRGPGLHETGQHVHLERGHLISCRRIRELPQVKHRRERQPRLLRFTTSKNPSRNLPLPTEILKHPQNRPRHAKRQNPLTKGTQEATTGQRTHGLFHTSADSGPGCTVDF